MFIRLPVLSLTPSLPPFLIVLTIITINTVNVTIIIRTTTKIFPLDTGSEESSKVRPKKEVGSERTLVRTIVHWRINVLSHLYKELGIK